MQSYTQHPLTDDTGLRPEKCPNCSAPQDKLGVLDQFENSVDMFAPTHISFEHARRKLRCLDCGHEWKLDRVRLFRR